MGKSERVKSSLSIMTVEPQQLTSAFNKATTDMPQDTILHIIEGFDTANCLRYLYFNGVKRTRAEVVKFLIDDLMNKTPNDHGWIDLHEGRFYHHCQIVPQYTQFTTLFDQRDESESPFPTTWDELSSYLLTHTVSLGWADRNPYTMKVRTMPLSEMQTLLDTMDPSDGVVPFTQAEIEEEEKRLNIDAEEDPLTFMLCSTKSNTFHNLCKLTE